jgi:hypothetical protein
MQADTCLSSSASAYVPRDCSLEAIPRYSDALRQDRRGLPGRWVLGGIYRLAQLMTGPSAMRSVGLGLPGAVAPSLFSAWCAGGCGLVASLGSSRRPFRALVAPAPSSPTMWRMLPNPSLHPTCYSRLRRLPPAGELKRWASTDSPSRARGSNTSTCRSRAKRCGGPCTGIKLGGYRQCPLAS